MPCSVDSTAISYVGYAGQHVQGSPFQVLVLPWEADAGSSRLYGPGLQAIQLGKPSSLFLQLADQWGNAVSSDNLAASGIKVTLCLVSCRQQGIHDI